MNVREIYEERLLIEAYKRLQEARLDGKDKRLVTQICSPEVLPDNLVENWLALNYLFTVGFFDDGRLIMGEIGGIIPTHPITGQGVLAVAEASVGKVMHGINQVKESAKTGNKNLISRLEEEIETKVADRQGITIIDGNRNFAHYDFTTKAGVGSLAELLETNGYLMLSADGFTVVTHKCLKDQSYVMNVPVNGEIFEAIRKNSLEDTDGRLKAIKINRGALIPKDFVAGFKISYNGGHVRVYPVIPEKTLKEWEAVKKDLNPSKSKISCLGNSDPYGGFSVMDSFLD
jgi:hypothetical protein